MAGIEETASIRLITGVPGSGKSLRAVWYLREAVQSGDPVFACNINGLNIPGVMPFEDPTKWQDLPAGSLLVVDEAQKYWRAGVTEEVVDAAGKRKVSVPLNIQAMETIRHAGVRLILITQSPTLLHANVRQFVGLHEHLVRSNGRPSVTIYRRSSCIDNVRSSKALAAEDKEDWAYPKDVYELYKSAEVHTVKRTVSAKYKRTLVLALTAVALFIGIAVYIKAKTAGEEPKAPQKVSIGSGFSSPRGERPAGTPKWANKTDYQRAHLPREGTSPWSAPVFDDRAITSDPQVFCMSSGQGDDGEGGYRDFSCTCLTEQGTYYEMDVVACRTVARRGPDYNPYKQLAPSNQQPPPTQEAHGDSSSNSGVSVARGSNRAATFPEAPGYACETCGD